MNTSMISFPASKSEIWMNCVGSTSLSADFKSTKTDSKDAIAGTRAHWLLSQAIKSNTNPKHLLLAIEYADVYGKWHADQAMISAVSVAYDYLLSRMHEMSVAVVTEKKVDPSTVVGGVRGEMNAICDAYLKTPNFLEVIEFKYGMSEVQVTNNSQLDLCVAGVIAEYEEYNPQNIQTTVIQPRIAVLGQSPFKTQNRTLAEMTQPWALISKALSLSKKWHNDKDPSNLTAGSWCKYCLALGHCSANTEQSLKVLNYDPSNVVDQSMKHVDATTLPDAQLVEIYLASKQIRQTLVACQDELTKRAHNKPIKGVKLVNGAGSKSWNVSEEEIVTTMIDLRIPHSALYNQKFLSPAQALKLTWTEETKNGHIKSSANKTQKDKFTELMTIEQGKPTLALENDSRKAIGSEVEKMFAHTKVDKERTLPKGWSL